jgi:peptide/nickel transport system ATP-binding protein
VLSEGLIVERGVPQQLFHAPQHPYTRALVRAVPQIALQRRS